MNNDDMTNFSYFVIENDCFNVYIKGCNDVFY